MRRQAPPVRPMIANDVVAAPWSIARKARGPERFSHRRVVQASQADLLVDLLEARDEQLDAGLVGEDLAGGRQVPPEQAAQGRVEEEHRVRAERPIRAARLEEVDGRRRQAAELDLAGDLLDELVALLLGRLERQAHRPPAGGSGRRAADVPSVAANAS